MEQAVRPGGGRCTQSESLAALAYLGKERERLEAEYDECLTRAAREGFRSGTPTFDGAWMREAIADVMALEHRVIRIELDDARDELQIIESRDCDHGSIIIARNRLAAAEKQARQIGTLPPLHPGLALRAPAR